MITSQPELNLLKIVTVKRRFRTKDKVELQRLLVIVYTLMNWLNAAGRSRFDDTGFVTERRVFVAFAVQITDKKVICQRRLSGEREFVGVKQVKHLL